MRDTIEVQFSITPIRYDQRTDVYSFSVLRPWDVLESFESQSSTEIIKMHSDACGYHLGSGYKGAIAKFHFQIETATQEETAAENDVKCRQ